MIHNVRTPKFFRAVCPRCATVFDFEESDTEPLSWEPGEMVGCPSCGWAITFRNHFEQLGPEIDPVWEDKI